MIVPPRLVAGWFLGGAAVMLLLATASPGDAQTSTRQSSAPSAGSRTSQVEWGGEAGAPSSPSRDERALLAKPASWRSRGYQQIQPGYTPRHLRARGAEWQDAPGPILGAPGELMVGSGEFIEGPAEVIGEGAPIPDGAILEGAPGELLFDHHPVGGEPCCEDGACGGSCGNSCGQGCCAVCAPCCCLIPCLGLPHNFLVHAGVHGFKGPINRGADSSFGFGEAFNWGGPLGDACGLGAQLGVRGIHSNFSGATGLTFDDRNQLFVTGGLFRRVDCGLQFGAVIDYLRDDWDISLDLAQVRGELSWVTATQSELGFRYAGPVTQDDSEAPPEVVGVEWEAVETYALFVRQRLSPRGGEAQAFAGFTGESEGLLGAQALVPLADHMALTAEFTYLVPEQGAASVPVPGSLDEQWNVSVGVVIYPDAGFLNPWNYYRPLFDVANNGTFLYDVAD